MADVYVDDEIQLAQGSAARLNRIRRVLRMHCNDLVFRPNNSEDDPDIRKEPMSMKKFSKGDGCWATSKTILGWTIDTLQRTIELPPHRQERLMTILEEVRGRKRVSVKSCHKLLGELRSMVMGIPGGRGLFSQLQLALTASKGSRVCLHQGARDHIEDLWMLAKDIVRRPTRIAEVLATQPSFIGACDAAKPGMGGVWLPPDRPSAQEPDHPPVLWRARFPDSVQRAVISWENPTGTVTNSDLELAGTIAHNDILAHEVDVRECTLGSLCDNTPAVSWRQKKSATTAGPASYLLREASLHQRQFRYVPLHSHIPGDTNAMADDTSRLWELDDSQLLARFNLLYPQKQPWHMRQLSPEMHLRLTSALLRKRGERPSLEVAPVPGITRGTKRGFTSLPRGIGTHISPTTPHGSQLSADGVHKAATRSDLKLFLLKPVRSRRRSPAWGPLTPVWSNTGESAHASAPSSQE